MLDDPEGLRVDTPPELHDTSVDDVLGEPSSPDRPDEDEAPAVHVDLDADDAADEEVGSDHIDEQGAGDENVVVLSDGIDVSGVDLTAAPEPARAPGGIFGATSQSAFEAQAEAAAPHLAAVPDERAGHRPRR